MITREQIVELIDKCKANIAAKQKWIDDPSYNYANVRSMGMLSVKGQIEGIRAVMEELEEIIEDEQNLNKCSTST